MFIRSAPCLSELTVCVRHIAYTYRVCVSLQPVPFRAPELGTRPQNAKPDRANFSLRKEGEGKDALVLLYDPGDVNFIDNAMDIGI
jgi:hypothetical protein